MENMPRVKLKISEIKVVIIFLYFLLSIFNFQNQNIILLIETKLFIQVMDSYSTYQIMKLS